MRAGTAVLVGVLTVLLLLLVLHMISDPYRKLQRIDLEDAWPRMQTGDLILTTRPDPVSLMQRYFLGARACHAALVVRDPVTHAVQVLEASKFPTDRIGLLPLDRSYLFNAVYVLWWPLRRPMEPAAQAALHRHIQALRAADTRYNLHGTHAVLPRAFPWLRTLVPSFQRHSAELGAHCAQTVFLALVAAGYARGRPDDGASLIPADMDHPKALDSDRIEWGPDGCPWTRAAPFSLR